MLFPFLLLLCSSSVQFSEVIRGNWSARYISPDSAVTGAEYDHRLILRDSGQHNVFEGDLDGELVVVRCKGGTLAGNITFRDMIFDFNFTIKARPYISSEFDLLDYGVAHCSFSSYTSFHCVWLRDGKTVSIFATKFKKTGVVSWLASKWKGMLLLLAPVVIYKIENYFVRRLQRDASEELRKKREAEKENNNDNGENENENENKNDEADDNTPKERIPDENGKVKTS